MSSFLYNIKRVKKILNYHIVLSKIRFFFYNAKNKKVKYHNHFFFLYTKNYPLGLNLPSKNLYCYRNYYEKNELNLIKKKINKGDIVIDIGANIGFYSFNLLKIVGTKGKLIIFEREKILKKILEKNCRPYKNYKIFSKNVGIRKNQIKIDETIKEKINFIKIDVDGFEYEVLKSAKYLIKKYKPKILIELNEDSLQNWGLDYVDVIKFLKNFNYKLFFVESYPKIFDRKLFKNEVINLYCE